MTIEIGIAIAVVGPCKSIPDLPLKYSLPEHTHLLIAVIVLALALPGTTAHLNHLRGTFTSLSPGRILPHGVKINQLPLVPLLLSPTPNTTRLEGTIRGMMAETPGK